MITLTNSSLKTTSFHVLNSVFNKVTPLNINANCDVIYLDFRKAFDTVPHNELLVKQWTIGITGNCWYWIKEYLSCRVQQVCINGRYTLPPSLSSLVSLKEVS